MAQSKEFVDASHALNDLSHALALLESENASLRGAVDGPCNDNAKLRELVADMWPFVEGAMDDEYCPAPKCPFTELCTENQVCMASSGFYYRMRELGVEL